MRLTFSLSFTAAVRTAVLGVVLAGASAGVGRAQDPAQDLSAGVQPLPDPSVVPPQTDVRPPVFRDTELGDRYHYGDNCAPGMGYPHRDLRSAHYGMWYRPTGLQGTEGWCDPLPFNPRGRGTPRHTSCYRMEYSPYVVQQPYSHYGPLYQRRLSPVDCCAEKHERETSWLW